MSTTELSPGSGAVVERPPTTDLLVLAVREPDYSGRQVELHAKGSLQV